MRNKKGKFTLALVGALLITALLFAVPVTGVRIHMLLGLVAVISVITHFIRKGKRIRFIPRSWRVTDYMLLLMMVILLVSGMLAHIKNGAMMHLHMHKMAACVLLLCCIVHVVQHAPKAKKKKISD